MTDARATLAIISEFVELAAERRQRPLATEARERMEALDDSLRELIEGAKPAPKRIQNPSAKASSTTPPAPSAPSAPSAPAPDKKASMHTALTDALELSATDKGKVRDVGVAHASSYTPPAAPAYMQDYFSEDIVPVATTKDLAPTAVINADGESVDLTREVRVLLGLEKPPPPPVQQSRAAPASASAPARAASETARTGTPVIVHLLAGGTKRGQVESFNPRSGKVSVTAKDGSAQDVTLKSVLAIFFGARRDKASVESNGTPIVVKLVNDRQLTGLSPDYSEGGDALTVVPTPKRGNIDHIWVPAWAVKAIELE